MNHSMKRRTFLKGSLAVSAVGVAVGAGVLTPRAVLAAWPKGAFEAQDVSAAMQSLFGSAQAAESGEIEIKAPDIAENGVVVPVTVSTGLSGVSEIGVYAQENPQPLTSAYRLADRAQGYVSSRIKMAKTSPVIAVVKADGKLYSAQKEVKVTIGGCGG